jgi:hypothetical protein
MSDLGVVFDIDALGGGFYGDKAWRIFMRTLVPGNIVGCTLREGDTNEALRGGRREFCIAVFGPRLDVDRMRKAFEGSSERGLATATRRFLFGPRLDSEPLADAGRVDFMARLVQDEWSRVVHDRCKECDWGFAPKTVPSSLPADLASELEALQRRTRTAAEPATHTPISTPKMTANEPSTTPTKQWWQFWR